MRIISKKWSFWIAEPNLFAKLCKSSREVINKNKKRAVRLRHIESMLAPDVPKVH